MSYCQSASKATVRYEFPSEKKRIYVAETPPIDVLVEQVSEQGASLTKKYNFTFDGQELTTYSYSCQAPANVPLNAICYITVGIWDDYGTIGSYSSPTVYGQINSFSGNPIQIGQGLLFTGTVTNSIRPNCSVNLTLQWRWGGWAIKVLKEGKIIFQDTGKEQPFFNVVCDDECPPETTKCFSTNYPGYCCLPCSEIAGEIKAIANQVRRINHG